MRMHRIQTAATAIAMLLLMTACGRSGQSGEQNSHENGSVSPPSYSSEVSSEITVPIKTATENFSADLEECGKRSYPNLDFSGAISFPAPVVSECYAIKCAENDYEVRQDGEMTIEEKLSRFESYCRAYLGEYNPENACFETSDRKLDGKEYEIEGIDGVEFTAFPKLSEYEKKIKSGEISPSYFLYVDNKKQTYLWWLSETSIYPHWYNKGLTLSLLNEYLKASSAIPTDIGEPIAVYPNDGSHEDERYRLYDGEVSIKEALDYFNNEYLRSVNIADNDIQNIAVRYINVYRVTEDIYAYVFIFTTAVDKIPFDRTGERQVVGDDKELFKPISHDGQALMIKKNDIDWAVGAAPDMSPEVGEPITEIIRFTDAADILSKALSENVTYKVLSAELVMTAGITDENKSPLLIPTWKLTLNNENDGFHYDFYINAISGELGYVRYNY